MLPRFAALACLVTLCLPAVACASDPEEAAQWYLGSAPGAVRARSAWPVTQGTGVVVAVVDTGINLDQPDLDGAMWTNPKDPANGVDDDGNGIVDDTHGVDLVRHTELRDDPEGHGTAMASIIAARRDGVGIVGVAPQAQIMGVRVLDESGDGTSRKLAEGIRYAADHGADIISMSLGGYPRTTRLTAAVRYAQQRGVLLVAPAGNEPFNFDRAPEYPAGYESMLRVAAGTRSGALASWAAFGPKYVQLAAPGVRMRCPEADTFAFEEGSSHATAVVAGVAALVASADPSLRGGALRRRLTATAHRTRGLRVKVAGGLVDARAAVTAR